MSAKMKFKDLLIGDTFDFMDEENPTHNNFFARCEKISKRKYAWGRMEFGGRPESQVGNINVMCFHVKGRNH